MSGIWPETGVPGRVDCLEGGLLVVLCQLTSPVSQSHHVVCHVRAILCFWNTVRHLSGPNGAFAMRLPVLWCYVYRKKCIATKLYAEEVVMHLTDA